MQWTGGSCGIIVLTSPCPTQGIFSPPSFDRLSLFCAVLLLVFPDRRSQTCGRNTEDCNCLLSIVNLQMLDGFSVCFGGNIYVYIHFNMNSGATQWKKMLPPGQFDLEGFGKWGKPSNFLKQFLLSITEAAACLCWTTAPPQLCCQLSGATVLIRVIGANALTVDKFNFTSCAVLYNVK